jgi:choloylglycine hydrolase
MKHHRVAMECAAWICTILLLGCAHTAAHACSVFSFGHDGERVMGRNLDWPLDIPGQVMVNPRGVCKTLLPWQGEWPSGQREAEPTRWTSRYASVTFTRFGRDFIESGMNEAGLAVAQANLYADYPPDDGRAGMSGTQWMQYLLDRYAGVDEVLSHLDDLRLDGEGWHYLLADASGGCAVIEFSDGSARVYTGETAPVCAMTNTGYEQALAHLPLDRSFGGQLDIAANDDSYGRFLRIARLLREPVAAGSATDRAFRVLDEVRADDTQRTVVFDLVGRRVSWRAADTAGRRLLEFRLLDLGPGAGVRVIDLGDGPVDDAHAALRDYSDPDNRALVRSAVEALPVSTADRELLGERGLDPEAAIDLIAGSPDCR